MARFNRTWLVMALVVAALAALFAAGCSEAAPREQG